MSSVTTPVYAMWRRVVGRDIDPIRADAFDSEAEALGLGRVPQDELHFAAQCVFASFGTLLLRDWRDEIDNPGLSNLCTVATRWSPQNEFAELVTLQQEVILLVDGVCVRNDTRPVLQHRLGFGANPKPTLEQIATGFEVSRERVRQLQERAIRRLAGVVKRSRRGLLTGEVLRDLINIEPDTPFAISLDELAGCLFPDAAPGIAVRVLAVVMGYNLQQQLDLTHEIRKHLSEAREAARIDTSDAGAAHRANAMIERLLKETRWPAKCGTETFRRENLARTREVQVRSSSGLFFSRKLGREVTYESQLERRFLLQCERSSNVAWYQEQPVIVGYEFEGISRKYHPDVLLEANDGRFVLVELKPAFEMTHAINRAKWRAAQNWCELHGVGLLITDLSTSREQLLRQPVPDCVRESFERQLSADLSWPQIRALQLAHNLPSRDFIALCLQQGWTTRQRPWRLHAVSVRH